jgi:hypothetical protein
MMAVSGQADRIDGGAQITLVLQPQLMHIAYPGLQSRSSSNGGRIPMGRMPLWQARCRKQTGVIPTLSGALG